MIVLIIYLAILSILLFLVGTQDTKGNEDMFIGFSILWPVLLLWYIVCIPYFLGSLLRKYLD